MAIRGQSKEARLERMKNFSCPVHGAFMGQVEGWEKDSEDKSFSIAECERRTCDIRVVVREGADTAWGLYIETLTPEFLYLLDDE